MKIENDVVVAGGNSQGITRAELPLAESSHQRHSSNLLQEPMVAAWLDHVWDGFPREIWDGDRMSKWRIISSKDEYLAFLRRQHQNSDPSHTSINIGVGSVLSSRYAFRWINKVLLELDAPGGRKNLDTAYSEMRRLCHYLNVKYDAAPRVYFSGNRSFHIFVDFSPITLEEPVDTQREFARTLTRELSIKCLDFQVFAERKVSRIPYTLHEDTREYSVSISPFWSLEKIRRESSKPEIFEPIRINLCQKIGVELKRIDVLPSSTATAKSWKQEHPLAITRYGWIEKVLDHPVGDGRRRLLWHVLSPYVINVKKLSGADAESTLRDYFEHCDKLQHLRPSRSGFMRLIRYYLKLAQRDGYLPWRLETIQKKDTQLYSLIEQATA